MKRLLFFSLSLLFILPCSYAQKASEGNERFAKGVDGNAVSIVVQGHKKNVESVLSDKFKKVKGASKEKGFVTYRGTVIDMFSPKSMDYFYKVEDAGEDKAKVIFFASYGNENFISSADDAGCINGMKATLEGMVTEIRRFELELAIAAQTKIYERSVKDQEDLVKDGEKLVKEKESLEEDLAQNELDLEENKTSLDEHNLVVEEEKKMLDELQAKLGGVK